MAVSLISTIRDLHRRRARERRGLTLAEGVRLLEEALAAGVVVRGAAVAPALEGTPRGVALKQRLARAGVPLEEVDDDLLGQLADDRASPGDRGGGRAARLDAWRTSRSGPRSVVLVLDGVQDPGNVGALARDRAGARRRRASSRCPGTAELDESQGAPREHGRAVPPAGGGHLD